VKITRVPGWWLVLLIPAVGVLWVLDSGLGIRIHPNLVAVALVTGWASYWVGVFLVQLVRSASRPPAMQEARLALWETDLGREAGWYVEHHGRPVALLTDPRFEDMFWESYRIEPLVEDEQERQRLLSDAELWLRCEFVYRSRRFGAVAPFAFPAGSPFPEAGRVTMRGLYLPCEEPTLPERMVLWWRRRNKQKANSGVGSEQVASADRPRDTR
jgi:hypothetical protein